MRTRLADALTHPLPWLLVALCPLLTAGSTLAGAVAIAIAVPVVVAAGWLVARMTGKRWPGATGPVMATIVSAALAATMADALTALWPALGDAPSRYLPLAVASAFFAAAATGPGHGRPEVRSMLVAALLCAASLVAFAAAREIAGRLPQLALTPGGAFVVAGAAIAVFRGFVRTVPADDAAARRPA